MQRIIQVSTTADNKGVVEQIGLSLVGKKLIACAQITGPIRSTYTWKGIIENTDEWLLTMKTRASLYPVVEREIRNQHPYEVPEIIAIEISMLSPDYLEWVLNETIEAEQLIQRN